MTKIFTCWLVAFLFLFYSARCIHRTNRRAIAIMFVRPSVHPSVWDGHALISYGAP